MQLHVTDRVSTTMKRVGIAILIAAIIGSVWYLQRSTPKTSAATYAPESAPVETPKTGPAINKVTKLGSIEERKLLAERIEEARRARTSTSPTSTTATSAPKPPRLPDDQATPISAVEIRTAMREVIPLLADCYTASLPSLPDPHVEITAEIHLVGDPDIGTVIDAKHITDNAGQPLPAKFDDCLRSTFQTLALPPLAEGDEIDVRYPFVFDNQE